MAKFACNPWQKRRSHNTFLWERWQMKEMLIINIFILKMTIKVLLINVLTSNYIVFFCVRDLKSVWVAVMKSVIMCVWGCIRVSKQTARQLIGLRTEPYRLRAQFNERLYWPFKNVSHQKSHTLPENHNEDLYYRNVMVKSPGFSIVAGSFLCNNFLIISGRRGVSGVLIT